MNEVRINTARGNFMHIYVLDCCVPKGGLFIKISLLEFFKISVAYF